MSQISRITERESSQWPVSEFFLIIALAVVIRLGDEFFPPGFLWKALSKPLSLIRLFVRSFVETSRREETPFFFLSCLVLSYLIPSRLFFHFKAGMPHMHNFLLRAAKCAGVQSWA